jgi:hypothetical protein
MSSDAVHFTFRVPSIPASCTVAVSFRRGVPLREADFPVALPDEPCGEKVPPSLSVRPAALLGFSLPPFAGLFPRMGEHSISGSPGPRVVSHAAHPPRLIFVGVTHRPRH